MLLLKTLLLFKLLLPCKRLFGKSLFMRGADLSQVSLTFLLLVSFSNLLLNLLESFLFGDLGEQSLMLDTCYLKLLSLSL